MSLNFPIARSIFLESVPVSRSTPWRLDRKEAISGDGRNQVIVRRLAEPMWTGTMYVDDIRGRDLTRAVALLEAIGTSGRVLLYDVARPFPRSDPFGTALSDDTLVVTALGSDGRSLRLTNLPGGFQISVGDWVSIGYRGSYRWLGQAVEDVQASGGGTTPMFEVTPALSEDVQVGASATMRRAYAICRIAAFEAGMHLPGGTGQGLSFTFKQVPR